MYEPVPGPSFGIIVTTIGRPAQVGALLGSLARQSYRSFEVAVIAQGEQEAMRSLVHDVATGTGLKVTFVAGEPNGAAAGRNAAERALPAHCDFLLFPNDTSVYPPSVLSELARRLPGTTGAAVTVSDEHGEKFHLPGSGTPLTARNAWSVILPGLVMRRAVFQELRGFDESIGTGAPTPWQSGEETDLLLRYLRLPDVQGFCWLPEVVVRGAADTRGLTPKERRRKLRAYSRGYGRVLVRHRYGVLWYTRALLAGATFGLRHREQYGLGDGLWVFLGRVEGLAGRTLGRGRLSAVTK